MSRVEIYVNKSPSKKEIVIKSSRCANGYQTVVLKLLEESPGPKPTVGK